MVLNITQIKSIITREWVSMLGISDAAEQIGFRTMGGRWNSLGQKCLCLAFCTGTRTILSYYIR